MPESHDAGRSFHASNLLVAFVAVGQFVMIDRTRAWAQLPALSAHRGFSRVGQTWCFAVASAKVDAERAGLANQWLEGDDRVVVVPLADPLALTTWALTRDGLEHVVFIGRAAHTPSMAVAANLLTGRLPRLQLSTSTWRTTTLSLAALAAQVHESVESAHEAVAQMRQLVPATWSGVWMPSVTGLSEPRPSFGQHLRSMMPGRPGYLATLTPQIQVMPLQPTGGAPVVPGSTLIVGGQLRESDLDAVQRQTGVSHSVVLSAVEDGRSQYGSSEAVELVSMPEASVVQPGGATGWCQVCRSAVWGESCPFCRVAVVRYQGAA